MDKLFSLASNYLPLITILITAAFFLFNSGSKDISEYFSSININKNKYLGIISVLFYGSGAYLGYLKKFDVNQTEIYISMIILSALSIGAWKLFEKIKKRILVKGKTMPLYKFKSRINFVLVLISFGGLIFLGYISSPIFRQFVDEINNGKSDSIGRLIRPFLYIIASFFICGITYTLSNLYKVEKVELHGDKINSLITNRIGFIIYESEKEILFLPENSKAVLIKKDIIDVITQQ